VVNMVLAVEGGDVGAAQGAAALVAEQAQASEVVGLTEGILSLAVLIIRREELGCDDVAAVL